MSLSRYCISIEIQLMLIHYPSNIIAWTSSRICVSAHKIPELWSKKKYGFIKIWEWFELQGNPAKVLLRNLWNLEDKNPFTVRAILLLCYTISTKYNEWLLFIKPNHSITFLGWLSELFVISLVLKLIC